MDTTKICPRCRTPLPGDAPGGLCPRCLMDMNLATETEVTGAGDSPKTTPSPEELAAKFPQLEILGLLGRGGMGAVYKARQKELDRVVALKILPPGIGDAPAFAERFAREAKALAKLNHSNIVTLYEFGRADGLFYFLMEFVDGVNLRQLLDTKRVSPREALAIVPQICDALQYAHDQGIVHRDIKPENILMDRRGRVKVADFGLAKLIAAGSVETSESAGSIAPPPSFATGLTDPHKVMGTPQYMAPEQKQAPLEVDHRADIYALGVVFYQMLTGELPAKRIEPPSRKVQVDVRLDEIVLRALELTPERRFQSAEELKTGVETIAAQESTRNERTSTSQKRQPILWVAYACFLTGTVGPFLLRKVWHLDRLQVSISSVCLLAMSVVLGVLVWKRPFSKAIIAGSLLVLAFTGFNLAKEAARPVFVMPSSAVRHDSNRVESRHGQRNFGPPRETVIEDDHPGASNFLFDLDRQMFISPKASREMNWPWVRTNGIDLTGGLRPHRRGIATAGETVVVPVSNEFWNSSEQELEKELKGRTAGNNEMHALAGTNGVPATFAIKTREGAHAIVQILGFVHNPAGTKIRYKVARPASANREGTSSVAKDVVFRPVIERTINDDGARTNFFVDLDSDRSFTPPRTLKLTDASAFIAWSRSNGIDVMGETGQSVRGLVGFEFAVRPIASQRWDKITAQEVAGDEIALSEPGLAPATMTAKGELPETFIFKTREGGAGVLQIVGFAENPRGVKVRYKMVQDGASESAREEKTARAVEKVVERVLLDPDNYGGRNEDTLNLRTGELSLVAGSAPKDQGGRLRALAASQGDLFVEYGDFVSKKWALVGAGLKLGDLLASQWETSTDADLVKALATATALEQVEYGGVTLFMLPQEMLPLTLAFEARDGTRGVLQVTGFDDNPRSVKIRYRLVASGSAKEQSKVTDEGVEKSAQQDYRRMIQIDSVIVEAPKQIWNWLTHRSYNTEKLANDPQVKMLRGPRIHTEEGKETTLHLFSGVPDRGAQPQHDVVRVRATLDGERIRHSVKGHFTKVDDTWISPANLTDDAGLAAWGAPMIYGLPSADNDRTRFAVLTLSPVVRPRLLEAAKEKKPQGTRAIFGPVIEKAFDGQTNILLNLAQSRVLAFPPDGARDELEKKMVGNEVDFMFAAGQVGDLPVLNWEMRTRLDAARLRGHSFEDVTMEEISEALDAELLSRVSYGFPFGGPIAESTVRYDTFSPDDYPPKTFAFKTADNKIGVLEVVSFTTDIHPPQELVIRYKFLQQK